MTPPVQKPTPTMNPRDNTINAAVHHNQTTWGAQSKQTTSAPAPAAATPPTYAGALQGMDFGGPFGLAPPTRCTAGTYPSSASQFHAGVGSPSTRTPTQGRRDRSRGGSRSGPRRRPSESAFAHKKRWDQGPLPSGADVYPVDAGYVNPGGRPTALGTVQMWVAPAGQEEGGGVEGRAPESSGGGERRADWRYTMEEDSGVIYGITMGG
ncbi:hypothetical protein BCR34DRAFT_231859 [Clohesyomyces aquaticus]|uniref:Uncharacterized protein n=1 Tax=Clohesyomyces aquaticus TaxID=1231657 RepID=A0A1Y1ZVY7_9PLEO|nr:hypothetical protein BCR34DRAFT_231859 [Clohesyomyces aquaticus]